MACSQTTEPVEPKKRPTTDGWSALAGTRATSDRRQTTALPQRAILPRKTLVEELAVAPLRQTGKKTRSSRPALGDLDEYPQIARRNLNPAGNPAEAG